MAGNAIDIISDSSIQFRVFTLVIFICAILHTLFANYFTRLSEKAIAAHHDRFLAGEEKHKVSFLGEILHFFGEVEVIFGLWVFPLIIAIVSFYNFETALKYVDSRIYVEAMFVVVIMSITASKPIIRFSERKMRWIAQKFGATPVAWWMTILTVGPLLGSLITEAGAMTLCALLLARRFSAYEPSKKLAYATLGLLFVNISVGGILTNFAAPPVLIVKRVWEWSSLFMFTTFGLKAISGLLLSNLLYYVYFRKEFRHMKKTKHIADEEDEKTKEEQKEEVPIWVTCVHVFFLVWTIVNSHYPAVFIGGYLIFLGFHQATLPHQFSMHLKRPLLVGLFLAGLIIHGGLQGWWISGILEKLNYTSLMLSSMALTAFNDNAAIAYLSTLVPETTDAFKYAVISGAVVGGGLTVIANAPNPAGLVILKKYFDGKVSPLYLFLGALVPTTVFFIIFHFFSHFLLDGW